MNTSTLIGLGMGTSMIILLTILGYPQETVLTAMVMVIAIVRTP
jgi:hypothetical protein